MKSINPCISLIQKIYDIVKAHGGEITINTSENEGTEFTIQIPIEKNV